jgi:hypothetical protein
MIQEVHLVDHDEHKYHASLLIDTNHNDDEQSRKKKFLIRLLTSLHSAGYINFHILQIFMCYIFNITYIPK